MLGGAATTDKKFYDAFEQHAACLVKAARLLVDVLDGRAIAGDSLPEITRLEEAGDRITHDTIAHLHKTWITPLDRSHIQALMSGLDDVLDCLEAVANRLVLFEIDVVPDDARKIAKYVLEACLAVELAVKLLWNVKQPARILQLCIEINRLENEGDTVYHHALAELYRAPARRAPGKPGSVPPPHDPLDVMKWRDVYDNLETATDRCEDVANIFEGIVLESA